jgi:hypothetical protein
MTVVLLPNCTGPEEKNEQFLMLNTLNILKEVAPMHDCEWYIQIVIILVQDKILNTVALLNDLYKYSKYTAFNYSHTNKQTGWPESTNELLPTEQPPLVGKVSAKLLRTVCCMVSGMGPQGHILGFLDRSSYYFF